MKAAIRRNNRREFFEKLAKKFKYQRSGTGSIMLPTATVMLRKRFTKFDIPKMKISRSSRFQQLKAKTWRRSSIGRPAYRRIYYIALERLQYDMVKRLSIAYDVHICKHGLTTYDAFPHKLFSWDYGDFLERRKQETVWIDVLGVQMNKECLATRKFKSDLEEIRRYLRMIFKFHDEKHRGTELKEQLFAYFAETIKLLEYEDDFHKILQESKKKLTDLSMQYINISHNPAKSRKNYVYKLFLEDKFMNSDVFYPIERRYHRRYFENRIKEAETKCLTVEDKLENDIKQIQILNRIETKCTSWLMTFYNHEIESFKDRISVLSTTYDIEFEKIDNENTYYKIKIDKLKEQRKFLTEQLLRFREELEILREKELAEQQKRMALSMKEKNAVESPKKGKKKKTTKGTRVGNAKAADIKK